MAQENPESLKKTPSEENIFDEFTNSEEIRKEIEQSDVNSEKDIYFYLKKISSVLLVLNILTLLFILLGMFYIYVQNSEQKKEYSYLSPVCNIFLGSKDYFPNTCYGVSPLLSEYQTKLSDETQNQITAILPLLGQVYSLENFNLSKKVSFILEKSENRLRVTEILSEFDRVKNVFSPTDKGEIDCYSIKISENILDITCDSYSSDWNTDILTVNDTTLLSVPGGGTSISKASSFLSFLGNYSNSKFEVIGKPAKFSSTSTQKSPYTQKTTFQFQLLYKQDNIYKIN